MEEISGVVATTFNFANAEVARRSRTDNKASIRCIKLKFVSAMSAKEEFKLQPDGMFIAEVLAVVVIVLDANLGELAGIEGQVWGDTRALAAEDVLRIECAGVSIGPFAAKASNPSRFEAPKQLRIKTPIAQRLGRERRGEVGAGLKTLVKRFGLP